MSRGRRRGGRRHRSRQTDNSCGQSQSPSHSAHVGQEVEVHYRWHALYGRRVRRQYVERRTGGEVVHVEVAPGVVIVVAAWMLDPAVCATMACGSPRVTVLALAELHQLLIERGFRGSSPDDPTIVQEEQDEKPASAGTAVHDPASAQHPVRFGKASRDQPLGAQHNTLPAGPPPVGGRRRRSRRA